MEQYVSKYQSNVLASKKYHLYSRLFDYFLTAVVGYLLYTLLLPLSTNFGVVKNIYSQLTAANVEAFDYIDSTRLQTYNENKTDLLTVNDGAEKYVQSLAKTSAYIHDLTFPVKQEDGTYQEVVVNKNETFIENLSEYPLDDVSYYYYIVKANEPSLNDYNGKTFAEMSVSELETYVYIDNMKVDASLYVSSDDTAYQNKGEGVSRFVVLNLENTNKLLTYYRGDTNDKALYNSLFKCYANAIQAGIKDVEANSAPFKDILGRFNAAYQKTTAVYVVVYFVCYVITYLLLLFIPRLLYKEWQTVGQHVLNIGVCDKNEMELSIWRLLAYHGLNFLAFSTTSIIAFALIGKFGALSMNIMPHINILMVMLFILTLNLISLFMPLFQKNNHDLTTLIAGVQLKDKNTFDAPIVDDLPEEDKQEDGRED